MTNIEQTRRVAGFDFRAIPLVAKEASVGYYSAEDQSEESLGALGIVNYGLATSYFEVHAVKSLGKW